MNYRELKAIFHAQEERNKKDGTDEHIVGYIVFAQESFTAPYSEASRTYAVSSFNKAFIPGMGGYSIYGSAIDGSDDNVRLEAYMKEEQGGADGWIVERCYLPEKEVK